MYFLGPCLSLWRRWTGTRAGLQVSSRLGGTSLLWCDRQFDQLWDQNESHDWKRVPKTGSMSAAFF